MSQQVKLFLGAYINSTNSQNLSCLSMAKHLDKEKFKVFTLEIYSGNLESQKGKITGVKVFNCFWPFRISIYLGFLWGIWKCDVAYLSKGQLSKFNCFLLKLLNKKSMNTVQGILDDVLLPNEKMKNRAIQSYQGFTKLYSITQFLKKYNFEKHKLECENKILYLGVEIEHFLQSPKHGPIKNIVLIGDDLIRKGVFDFFSIAKDYPDVNFHIIGTGNGKIDARKEIEERDLGNVIFYGGKTKKEIIKLLSVMQLHILPSRSEGFPKVTLETAAAGVPSVVYSDYGADEWISHGKDGFVVDTIDEIKDIIDFLTQNPDKLKEVSANAIELAKRFDWKVLIKEWEREIMDIYNS